MQVLKAQLGWQILIFGKAVETMVKRIIGPNSSSVV